MDSILGRNLQSQAVFPIEWGLLEVQPPITGIAGCCARAASGHATAAPPMSDMNSRRLR
jgi:hypothetical protein